MSSTETTPARKLPPKPARSTVGAARCTRYQPNEVSEAVRSAAERAGDIFAQVKRGDQVFVKPNHLGEHPVSRAVNTHPEVLAAVLEILLDHGAKITIGDCLDREGDRPFHTSGHWEACQRFGLEPTNLRTVDFKHVPSPGAVKVPEPLISSYCADADHVVNLPKLKAHLLATLTLGIKNLYGLFPHKVRYQYHRTFPAFRDFSEMLGDLFGAVRPQINVMDGIIGMEGMGPGRKGTPKAIGVVLASSDTVAMDSIASHIVGQNPLRVHSTRICANRGFGNVRLEDIDLVGPTLPELKVKGFKIPTGMLHATTLLDRMPAPAAELANRLAMSVREVPDLVTDKCTGCGDCVVHCPEGVIDMVTVNDDVAAQSGSGEATLPKIDLDGCVPCFSCVEFCPEDALERSWNTLGKTAIVAFKQAGRARRTVKRALGMRK